MKRILPVLILNLLPAAFLFAHPHMLVFASCELEFDGDALRGFWVELEFDSFFSGEIIWGYDEDGNRIFDERETANLYGTAFSSLGEYNYFVFLREGAKRFSPERVESFSARCEGPEKLFYRYFIPLEGGVGRDFFIAIYDFSYFCAVRYQEEDYILRSGTEPGGFGYDLEENRDYPVYYNPKGKVTDKTLYDRWAPGLNTFIPVEIHVTY